MLFWIQSITKDNIYSSNVLFYLFVLSHSWLLILPGRPTVLMIVVLTSRASQMSLTLGLLCHTTNEVKSTTSASRGLIRPWIQRQQVYFNIHYFVNILFDLFVTYSCAFDVLLGTNQLYIYGNQSWPRYLFNKFVETRSGH